MVLFLAVPLGILVGLALGGRIEALADLHLRGTPLFAIVLGGQVVAYPAGILPFDVPDAVATTIWLSTYAVLVLIAVLNRHVRGFPIAAIGMLSNLAAVAANGGHMPALASAMRDAGVDYTGVHANSVAASDPSLPWLIDRWGAPDWVPLANVYSVGDVLLGVGAIVIVSAAMGARLPSLPRSRRGAATD